MPQVRPRQVHRRVRAQQRERLAVQGGLGQLAAEQFDKPGIAVLGCNIHDGMVAWVVVTDTPLWARSVAGGHARVADVAPGSYQMHVWHSTLAENAAPMVVPVVVAAGDVEQRVRLGAGGSTR